MLFLNKKQIKSLFINDVTKLIAGSVVAQIIAFAASPILTRMYDPEAFGQFAVFISISSVFGVVISL